MNVLGEGVTVRVSLPLSYESTPNEKYNTLYIVDDDPKIFESACQAANNAYASVHHLDGRNWFPELLVVAVQRPNGATPEHSIASLTNLVVAFVDNTYRTFPYAAGRALCGQAADGRAAVLAALRDPEKLKTYQNVLLGAPDTADGVAGKAPLEAKTAVLLQLGTGEGEAKAAAARACKAALDTRAGEGAQMSSTVMQVDRYGEQHYRQEAQLGVLIELSQVDGAPSAEDATRTAVEWVCARFEKRKLERLGSLLPWHEFK